jgi:anti-sigma factor RsiW
MTCDELHGRLMAYVDSELTGEELTEVESHVRGCSGCAADALGMLQTKLATRAAGMRYAPSAEFRRRMEQGMRAKQKPAWWSLRWPSVAMAAVAAMILLAAVTVLVNHNGRERELTEIADLHVTELASANPVDVVSTDRHTVKPWFAGRLPFSFNLPELQNSEFTLVGGKVAYFERSPGAELLFNLRKHQVSVFVFKDEAPALSARAGVTAATRLALQMETWSEGGLRYYIVSDAPATDVHALGELLRKAARP